MVGEARLVKAKEKVIKVEGKWGCVVITPTPEGVWIDVKPDNPLGWSISQVSRPLGRTIEVRIQKEAR